MLSEINQAQNSQIFSIFTHMQNRSQVVMMMIICDMTIIGGLSRCRESVGREGKRVLRMNRIECII
jgi:hypothetical protein